MKTTVHLQALDSKSACGRTVKLSTGDLSEVTCESCLKSALRRPRVPKTIYTAEAEPIRRHFFTKVAGVSFVNTDGSSRQKIIARCHVGERLDLIREPYSRYDPEGAIRVMRRNHEQLGYIPAYVSRGGEPDGLAAQMDLGWPYRCRIADITGGGDFWLGVNIEITDEEWTEGPAQFFESEAQRHEPESPSPVLAFLFIIGVIATIVIIIENLLR